MIYDAFSWQMRDVIKTLHSIDRSLSIIAKDIEKKNQKWSSTNDIMKKYFWKFFKPKNKEDTLIAFQDINNTLNETRIVINNIDDEANKLKY